MKHKVVAFSGNPNCGKSSLINSLTGSKLDVGNWPGVTVEKISGKFELDGEIIEVVDLPGAYSLSPYSEEERVARHFIINDKPDLLINVIDATNLERGLNLFLQMREMNVPMIVVLNMYDELDSKGMKIDKDYLGDKLGVKIIPTVAVKNKGLNNLKRCIKKQLKNDKQVLADLHYSSDLETVIANVMNDLNKKEILIDYPQRWLAIKIIEGDEEIVKLVGKKFYIKIKELYTGHLRKAHDKNLDRIFKDERFGIANGIFFKSVKEPKVDIKEKTEVVDSIILNKYFGVPIFFFFMWLMFKLTFDFGNPFVDWLDGIVNGPIVKWAGELLTLLSAPNWFRSLLIEGVLAGVGGILVFVPIVFILMMFITFLQASGYMARAAFLMDKTMHHLGLHGKSFIPIIIGFGCNVPSVYATRIIENKRNRILTALLSPFASCSARIPVYALFAGTFFSARYSGTIIFSIYMLGILMIFVVGVIFRKTLFKGDNPEFIMELPPYRMPSMKNLFVHTWEKVKHFVVKAGTVILSFTIILWFLTTFPLGNENIKDSYFGKISNTVKPIFQPLGFGTWQASASILTGIGAKEMVVSSMHSFYVNDGQKGVKKVDDKVTKIEKKKTSFGKDVINVGATFLSAVKKGFMNMVSIFGIKSLDFEPDKGQGKLRAKLKKVFTPLSAYSFMVFILLYIPCIAFIAALKHEFGTWKWPLVAVSYQFVVAWIVSFIVYQGGQLLGFG